MPAVTKIWWNSSALEAALKSAFRSAALDAKKVAQAKSPSKRVARAMNVQFTSGISANLSSRHFLAPMFEKGTQAHTIAPRKTSGSRKKKGTTGTGVALKFKDGGFARGPVPHPGMKSRPFLRPVLPLFPGIYRAKARAKL